MCIVTPMPPKERFQLMLEPAQLQALRRIEDETGAPLARQIRRAIDGYLRVREGTKSERKSSYVKVPRTR
jgi:hypothetical protein